MSSPALRRTAPLAAAVAVIAVVAAVAYAFRDAPTPGGSPSAPPPLRIGGAAERATATDAQFTVRGDLPAGPDEAPVHRFTDGDADVARLAEVLGVDPDDVTGGAATQTDGADVLRVGSGPGRPWQFVRADAAVCLEPLPGAAPDEPISCAVPPADGRPAVQPPPTEQEARDAAAPVLDAVGLDPDEAVVGEPGGTDTRTVRVDPRVGDAPTAGVASTVTVDADGIVAAQGWLGGTREGDRYPVVTAEAALDRLAAMPVPLIGCPEGEQPVPPAPLCGGPLEVTGASFGLSLQHEGERPVLVPSWLFDVAGGTEPLAVVAVEAAYLEPVAGSGGGAGSDGTGGAGASPGTAEPQPVEPVAPKAEPPTATSRFESVAPSQDGTALVVTFYGGVEDCYTYDVRADETARAVSLRLTERRSGDVCIELAQRYERTVPLERPLGDRVVVDAESRLPLYPVRAER